MSHWRPPRRSDEHVFDAVISFLFIIALLGGVAVLLANLPLG